MQSGENSLVATSKASEDGLKLSFCEVVQGSSLNHRRTDNKGEIIKGKILAGHILWRVAAVRIVAAGMVAHFVCVFLLFDEAHRKIVD